MDEMIPNRSLILDMGTYFNCPSISLYIFIILASFVKHASIMTHAEKSFLFMQYEINVIYFLV